MAPRQNPSRACSHKAVQKQRGVQMEMPPLREEAYRSLYERNFDAVFVVDREGRFVEANPAASRISGYSIEELSGKTFKDLCAPAALEKTVAAFEEGLSGKAVEIETTVLPKSGGPLEMLVSSAPIALDGKIKGIFGIAKDITERKRSEAEIRQLNDSLEQQVAERSKKLVESEALFRSIYERAPTGIAITDFEGRFVRCNPAFCKIVGYNEEELLGQHFSRLIYPDDLERHMGPIRALAKEEIPSFEMESRYTRKDGSSVWAHKIVSALRDEKGRMTNRVALVSDISERKRAEEERRRNERNLSAFFDDAPVGLLWIGRDGRILRANKAQLEMLGCRESDMRGRSIADFDLDQDFLLHAIARLAAGRPVKNERARLRPESGPPAHALIDAKPVYDEEGQFIRSDWFVRDITQRVRLERNILNVSENERRQVGADLHDHLGQILHGANFLASELRERLKEKGAAEAPDLSRVVQALDEAITTTRDVVRGLQPVPPVPEGLMMSLREHAARIRKLYGVNCRFFCRYPVEVHDNAVAVHLFRIAQEATTNALRHAECRSVSIRLKAKPERLILGIKDDGHGREPTDQERKGMGLRLMQFRANAINGSIAVQRVPSGGTDVVCAVEPFSQAPLLSQA